MFVLEAAIERAAAEINVAPWIIQQKNLLQDGDHFPYGMEVKNCRIRRCWQEAEKHYDFKDLIKKVDKFNRTHDVMKKGLYHMPVTFGISFSTTFLNQAGALIHVYTDGSVGVSTGAVEMGQGVNAKILRAVAAVLSIDPKRVRVESTSTVQVANTSPTAASTGADLNGKAAELACRDLLIRLKKVAAGQLEDVDPALIEIREETVYQRGQRTELNWDTLIGQAYLQRVNLTAQAHYATPGIHFDKSTEKGEPFSYYAYGSAIAEVTVDCLRGRYSIDTVKVVHDAGESVEDLVDLGQIEGGIVQGSGWLTVEELVYDAEGLLLTEGLSNYKVPDIYFGPEEIQVRLLKGFDNPLGLLNSKAIGEPPFMYGIGVFQALRAAMRAFRSERMGGTIAAPLTPERVLMTLYGEETI
jgi:xanthine dehydrogenase large subunit